MTLAPLAPVTCPHGSRGPCAWCNAANLLDPPEPSREVVDAIEFAVRRSRGQYQRYRHAEIINAAVDECRSRASTVMIGPAFQERDRVEVEARPLHRHPPG